ncbi:retrovirus-related pol polyprotein from transposon TNT 1-94 [Tanacetum coccineum]|uniref:Retrovirus-related pol polyprotein from transposon TNT 1-94 n=1 Tax=Tanacetum coccineum TaxID=301880 RepID=A0ABQ5H166_9ASTR
MSMMGELKLFLELQSPSGIFISQSQYAIKLLKKHGMDECVSMNIPITTKRLDADLQGTLTDQTMYHRIMEGSYLTTSRPSIFIFTYFVLLSQAHRLQSNTSKGLNGSFDHAGCKDDYKSTSGGIQFLGEKLLS